ncbi:MerR family transcriptional regulator [Aeromicrobium wangtongii]|uniref:MerR family transcriptional regulator n=1 Tax=Aeromicrobium wangtongii TaxID=2969247 RepID=A0ABY5M9P1_9ACTN|nr:MerR family transcriptional regulator [Aeromicrobium wangtongii]MCD9197356.1 MerR family transcriptional regulator [Aeromicrobium wangtongii]UUP14850.1 MerR family transcriptional regulator [Aeromicrobium wangtongii]
MKSSLRSIGDTAAQFGLATHVLRHWEDAGLLAPGRDSAGRRLFGDDDLVRIAVILRSKAAGMSLQQIAVLLSDDHGRERHTVLQEHIADLDRRMAEMTLSRAMAVHAFECEAHDLTRCPGFRATIADVLAGTAPWPAGQALP